jgi:hypothetical protein
VNKSRFQSLVAVFFGFLLVGALTGTVSPWAAAVLMGFALAAQWRQNRQGWAVGGPEHMHRLAVLEAQQRDLVENDYLILLVAASIFWTNPARYMERVSNRSRYHHWDAQKLELEAFRHFQAHQGQRAEDYILEARAAVMALAEEWGNPDYYRPASMPPGPMPDDIVTPISKAVEKRNGR